jgi:hypothetical protein
MEPFADATWQALHVAAVAWSAVSNALESPAAIAALRLTRQRPIQDVGCYCRTILDASEGGTGQASAPKVS